MPQVDITVNDDDDALNIKVDPNPVQVNGKGPNNKPKKIIFNLKSNDYDFLADPAKAIQINKPDAQFGKPEKGTIPKKIVMVDDANISRGRFEYTIRVFKEGADGKDIVVIIDPLIENNT